MSSNFENEVVSSSTTTDIPLDTQSEGGIMSASPEIAVEVTKKLESESTVDETPKTEADNVTDRLACLIVNEKDTTGPEEAVAVESGTSDNHEGNTVKKSELRNQKIDLIAKYMNLATNKKRHAYLLSEQTISGFLVLCLGDEDPRVVERSMEVFGAFGKHPENISALHELNFLIDALRCVTRNPEVQNAAKSEARKLYKKLLSAPRVQQPLTELSDSARNIEAGTSVSGSSAGKDSKTLSEKPVDLNTTMSTMKRKNKGRETVLLLGNDVLQQRTERAKVTQVLISVPGIISVTYDIKKNHCIVRGKRSVPPEHFGRAVALLRIADVFIVRKNESGEEIQVPIPADDKENTMQYPPYPEEVENEVMDDSRTVARKDKLGAEDASFFKSAKNFLKNSFYW